MNAALLMMVSAFFVTLQITATPKIRACRDVATNPGTLLRLTKKGLDYGTEIGSKLLETFVRETTIQDYDSDEGDLKYNIKNLKLTQFSMPVLTNELVSPSSLKLKSNGGSAAIRGDCQAKKKILFFWVDVGGWFEASISNVGLDIQMQLANSALGKPQISNVGCSADIGNFNFKIHDAGIVGWFVNLFHDMIKKELKNKVQEQVCEQIKQFGIVHIKTSTHPAIQFKPGQVNLIADVIAELTFANTTIFSFNVHGDFDVKSKEITSADSILRAKATINDLKVTSVQTTISDLGPVGDVLAPLVQVGKPIAEELLNDFGQKGFPLPPWNGVQLKNIDISLLPRTLAIACDIAYTGV
uniref:Lipid-binding serum glycoprotein N-terminal domain-containing protein n=1 Tax=Plectus sambesii TaxID=2011161 RepID=A0A914UXW4_9BILA